MLGRSREVGSAPSGTQTQEAHPAVYGQHGNARSWFNLVDSAPRRSNLMPDTQTHVFRVSFSPKIYRDFEIPSARSLYQLASAIVDVYGFYFDHCFGFYSTLKGDYFESPVRYELFVDIGEADDEPGRPPARSVEKTRIATAFPEVAPRCGSCSTTATNGTSRSRRSATATRRRRSGIRGFSNPPARRRCSIRSRRRGGDNFSPA